ncbi:MAG: BrnT family toxin [Rhodobacteraceae bacterium]|nr:BrnT family toxin [Paracoccaceae bacterium]
MIEHFEWDENKRLSNLEKHKIDFNGAIRIFEHPLFKFFQLIGAKIDGLP